MIKRVPVRCGFELKPVNVNYIFEVDEDKMVHLERCDILDD